MVRYSKEKRVNSESVLNKTDFQCPSSWNTRFRQRHNIIFEKISGESVSVPVGVTENWLVK